MARTQWPAKEPHQWALSGSQQRPVEEHPAASRLISATHAEWELSSRPRWGEAYS